MTGMGNTDPTLAIAGYFADQQKNHCNQPPSSLIQATQATVKEIESRGFLAGQPHEYLNHQVTDYSSYDHPTSATQSSNTTLTHIFIQIELHI